MGTPLVMEALFCPRPPPPFATPAVLPFPFQHSLPPRTLVDPGCFSRPQAIQRPATSSIIAALTLVWIYLHRENLSYADVGMSYDMVCHQAQLWRIFSAQVLNLTP